MTKFGEYLDRKALKKSHISRRTGISTQRLSELSLKETARLKADELYLISLAIEADPCELLNFVCSHLKLPKEEN